MLTQQDELEEGINKAIELSRQISGNVPARLTEFLLRSYLANQRRVLSLAEGSDKNQSSKNEPSQVQQSSSRVSQLLQRNSRITPPEIKEPQQNIDFPSNVFSVFNQSGEFFAVYEGKLYTLGMGETEESGPAVTYKGVCLPINESESLGKLEEILLHQNFQRIDEYSRSFAASLVDSYRQKEDKLRRIMERAYSNIEEAVAAELFDSQKRLSAMQSKRTKKPSFKRVDVSEHLHVTKSQAEETINCLLDAKGISAKAIIGLFGHTYAVPGDAGITIDLEDIGVRLPHLSSLESLAQTYSQKLSGFVKSRVGDAYAQWSSEIGEAFVDEEPLVFRAGQFEEGQYGLKKVNEKTLWFYKKLPAYVIKKEGDYFLFPKATIATSIELDEASARLGFPAFVIGSYPHPFNTAYRYDPSETRTSKICHGLLNWNNFGRHPIKNELFTVNNLTEKAFAEKAITVLEAIEGIMHLGIGGSSANPFRSLTRNNFEENYIDEARAKEMQGRGIEIYDCDIASSGRA